MKLAQRMTRGFCSGICSTVDEWELVQDADDTKLMTRKSSGNSGAPPGVILSASTTVWMPVSPQHLLDFLQDEKTRTHWDVLSQDGPMQSMLRFSKGRELDNNISLLRASVSLPSFMHHTLPSISFLIHVVSYNTCRLTRTRATC